VSQSMRRKFAVEGEDEVRSSAASWNTELMCLEGESGEGGVLQRTT